MSTTLLSDASSLATLHSRFLLLLPAIQRHARFAFRRIRCSHQRDDCISETVALAWKHFVALMRRNKDAAEFRTTLALRCSQAVKNGRRLCSYKIGKDALAAHVRYHDKVRQAPPCKNIPGNVLGEALVDNMRTPVPDQVSFRQDFSAWHRGQTGRNQRIIDDLMQGERPLDVARRHGLTPGRITQLRGQFHQDWQHFCGEQPADQAILV